MKLICADWVVTLSTPERDALVEALGDVLHRYEAADEHDSEHYRAIRYFVEVLEGDNP